MNISTFDNILKGRLGMDFLICIHQSKRTEEKQMPCG